MEANALEQERRFIKALLEKGVGAQHAHYETRLAEVEGLQAKRREDRAATKTPAQKLRALDDEAKQAKRDLETAKAEVESLEAQATAIAEKLDKAKITRETAETKNEEAQQKYTKMVAAVDEAPSKAPDPLDMGALSTYMEGLAKACPALQQVTTDLIAKAKAHAAALERAREEAEDKRKAEEEAAPIEE